MVCVCMCDGLGGGGGVCVCMCVCDDGGVMYFVKSVMLGDLSP